MISRSYRYQFGALLLLVILGLTACEPSPDDGSQVATLAPVDTVFVRHENQVGFDMLYPEGWLSLVAQQGLMVFGPADTINQAVQDPGPSVTVFRTFTDPEKTEQENFDVYLTSGPLSSGFDLEQESIEARVGDRQGYIARMVTSEELEDRVALRVLMASSQADNDATYIFTASAPVDQWDEWESIFLVMFGSIEVNE